VNCFIKIKKKSFVGVVAAQKKSFSFWWNFAPKEKKMFPSTRAYSWLVILQMAEKYKTYVVHSQPSFWVLELELIIMLVLAMYS
jgi:hypothetical protein